MSSKPPASARTESLLAIAREMRPELHRYCARLVGSVIDGEEVVQDTLMRALAAVDEIDEATPVKPWLFRIAHNRAIDLLRSRSLRVTEPLEAADAIADPANPDPMEALMQRDAVRTAVARFVELPTTQRSVVILKDVLEQSLSEIAGLLGLSVDAVKAHLARGRARLKEINAQRPSVPPRRVASAQVMRYVELFNQRNWDGLRLLLADDVRLNQSTHPVRTGAQDVGMFFGIYSQIPDVRLAPAWLEGREAIAVFEGPQSAAPSYVMWLEWRDDRIVFIQDYRYAGYVIEDADLTL